ncbi:MAG TPA: ATP-binding protein, partial [Candidatus Altiarchaeales archaeon]|nr:ATP-binding protein [Candidatus Altiarchaeales archaeon]
YKPREIEQAPKKIYSIDTGFIVNVAHISMENLGRLMENLVAIELKRRGKEIYYWKDYQQREVDFVIKDGLKVKELIQVCYDIEDVSTKNRELKALIKAGKELKCKNLKVITWDYEGREEFKNKRIEFIPLWRWLLSL